MRKRLIAVAGMILVAGSLAAPAAASTVESRTATSSDFIAMLAPVTANKVSGSGEIWVTLTGNSAKFTLQVSGLAKGPHPGNIFLGQGRCPTAGAQGGHTSLSLAAAAPTLGTAAASLTTAGDTSSASALAMTRFPAASGYTYSRTFDVDPAVTAAVRNGTALFVVHGIDYNGNGRYDDVLGTTTGASSIPAEATDPALCGAFVPAQMQVLPKGSADTGGGSAAAVPMSDALWFGLAALALAGAAGVVSLRRRIAAADGSTVVTNGFRRKVR